MVFFAVYGHKIYLSNAKKNRKIIIKKYIKNYDYGERRKNPIPIIKESNLFKKINYLKNLLVKHLKNYS